MKKLFLILFTANSIFALAQDNVDGIKSQIDALNAQKATLEEQIKTLQGQLPAPVVPAWTYKGNFSLNIGETVLGYWAAGGTSNINLAGVGHAEANYLKGKNSWKNGIDGNLGFVKNFNVLTDSSSPVQKNNDLLQIYSQYMRELNPKLNVGINLNLLTQFYNTKAVYPPDTVISSIFAPAYLDIAPGLQWKPVPYFSLLFAPISGRFTIVANQTIRDRVATTTSTGEKLDAYGNMVGQTVRSEFGAKIILNFEKELFKNFILRSKMQLFDNYTRPEAQLKAIYSSRFNFDVNWQTDIFYKITKNISFNFGFITIKDDDVRFKGLKNPDADGFKSAWQIKQYIGLGFIFGN